MQVASTGCSRNGQGSKGVKFSIQPTDIESLALWKLNGREIKNVVKTVYLWCRYNALELSLARIEDGIELTAPFATKVSDDNESSQHLNKRARMD
jgi:hypothetical protein